VGHTCFASKTKAQRPSVRLPLVLIVFDVFEKQYLTFIVHLCRYVIYRMTLLSQDTQHPLSQYRPRNIECCSIKEPPCTLSAMTHLRPPLVRKYRLSQYFAASGHRRQFFSFQLDALSSTPRRLVDDDKVRSTNICYVDSTYTSMYTTTVGWKCVVKKYSLHHRCRDVIRCLFLKSYFTCIIGTRTLLWHWQ